MPACGNSQSQTEIFVDWWNIYLSYVRADLTMGENQDCRTKYFTSAQILCPVPYYIEILIINT